MLEKPALHPLDPFGRHDSDERVRATAGWNTGDTGATTGADSATAATYISDTTKSWSGTEFTQEGQSLSPISTRLDGRPISRTIIGGGAGTVTWGTPVVSGLDTAGGDNYFIGNRHVACADCHNTHASFKNPEGIVSRCRLVSHYRYGSCQHSLLV